MAGRIIGAVAWQVSEEPDVLLLCARATAHRVAAGDTGSVELLEHQLDRLWALRILRYDTPGWGLSYEWDSFNKGSVNPADTVYSYTTAAAALAFSDAYIVTGNRRYLEIAVGACCTLLTATCCWRQGPYLSVWYSDQPGDHQPESQTHNVNGLTLAALSRSTRLDGTRAFDQERAAILAHLIHTQGQELGGQRLADGMAEVARSNWRYRRGSPRPNDLMHECFIIDGLLESGDPAGYEAALLALQGIWQTHFQARGTPRDGVYTHGSLGWGAGGGLFALSSCPTFRSEAAGVAATIAATVDEVGRSSLAHHAQPRAQAWYGLGLARFAALSAPGSGILPPVPGAGAPHELPHG